MRRSILAILCGAPLVLLRPWGLPRLLTPIPNPLQGLPDLIGGSGPGNQLSAQDGGETPSLDAQSNRENRPGHQHPDWVLHQVIAY